MKLRYRKDRETYRVWNEEMDKYGMFEVLDEQDFNDLKSFVDTLATDAPVSIHKLFDLTLVEADD